MQAYMVRRRRELEELTAVSPDTSISRDLQAQLLLRFAGLNMKDKSQVLASTNNVWDMDKIEQALRTQFADIHLHEHRRPQMSGGQWPSAAPAGQTKGGAKGGKAKTGWRGQAYAAELPFEEDDPGEDIEFEPVQDETQPYEYEDDANAIYEEIDDTYLDLVDPEDPDSIEAYAVLNQAQAKLKKGKGKGRGGKGAPNKGSAAASSSSPPAVNNSQLPFKSAGPGRVQWQQNQDRKKKLALLKQKTQCSACG
eukprot:6477977-Amphidinium_carterae.1